MPFIFLHTKLYMVRGRLYHTVEYCILYKLLVLSPEQHIAFLDATFVIYIISHSGTLHTCS